MSRLCTDQAIKTIGDFFSGMYVFPDINIMQLLKTKLNYALLKSKPNLIRVSSDFLAMLYSQRLNMLIKLKPTVKIDPKSRTE